MTRPSWVREAPGEEKGEPRPAPGQIVACFDGGKRKDLVAGGAYVTWPDGRIREVARVFEGTTNEAEYEGAALALDAAISTPMVGGRYLYNVVVRGDSQLVIYQLSGRYRAQDDRMRQRCEACWEKAAHLRAHGANVRWEWVRRIHNAEADRVVQAALDRGEGYLLNVSGGAPLY